MSRHTPVFLRESNRARARRVANDAAQQAGEVTRAHNMLLPYVRRMENRALLVECRGDILLDTLMTIATLRPLQRCEKVFTLRWWPGRTKAITVPWLRRRKTTILAMLANVEPRAGDRARGCLAADAFALFLMGQWERIQQERAGEPQAEASEAESSAEVANA